MLQRRFVPCWVPPFIVSFSRILSIENCKVNPQGVPYNKKIKMRFMKIIISVSKFERPDSAKSKIEKEPNRKVNKNIVNSESTVSLGDEGRCGGGNGDSEIGRYKAKKYIKKDLFHLKGPSSLISLTRL